MKIKKTGDNILWWNFYNPVGQNDGRRQSLMPPPVRTERHRCVLTCSWLSVDAEALERIKKAANACHWAPLWVLIPFSMRLRWKKSWKRWLELWKYRFIHQVTAAAQVIMVLWTPLLDTWQLNNCISLSKNTARKHSRHGNFLSSFAFGVETDGTE